MFTRVETFLRKYARHALSAGLLFGLAWDALTIYRADDFFGNTSIAAYLLITAVTVILLAVYGRRNDEQALFFPLLVLQFCFGNLASALLVLFFKSGTLAGSALFLIPLGVLLVANELLHEQYMRTHVHIVVWYFFALTYAVFAVPIVVSAFGDVPVFMGIALALVSVGTLLFILWYIARERVVQEVWRISASIAVVTAMFVGLYSINAIPPVPLLSTHMGVYHSVVKNQDGNYDVTFEKPAWYASWMQDTSSVFSYTSGSQLYCFSSIYAPNGITTPIYHRIELQQADGSWNTVLYLPFDISGGRRLGYRGYSATVQVRPGNWRCSAETQRGALIARFSFRVVEAVPGLVSNTL